MIVSKQILWRHITLGRIGWLIKNATVKKTLYRFPLPTCFLRKGARTDVMFMWSLKNDLIEDSYHHHHQPALCWQRQELTVWVGAQCTSSLGYGRTEDSYHHQQPVLCSVRQELMLCVAAHCMRSLENGLVKDSHHHQVALCWHWLELMWVEAEWICYVEKVYCTEQAENTSSSQRNPSIRSHTSVTKPSLIDLASSWRSCSTVLVI